jgi:hypothetical protein
VELDGRGAPCTALASLLEAQLGALAPELAAVLELLAVGEPLDVTMVAGLTDREALEDAVALRLATVDGQAVRLAHPMYGESVLTRAGPLRARRRRGQIVEALMSAEPDGGEVLRLAVLALDSDRPPDPKLLAAGARAAVALADHPLAERLARAACDVGAGFDARLLLAMVLSFQFKNDVVERELARAERAAVTEEDRVRLVLCRYFHRWGVEDMDGIEALLSAAEGSPPRGEECSPCAGSISLATTGSPRAPRPPDRCSPIRPRSRKPRSSPAGRSSSPARYRDGRA